MTRFSFKIPSAKAGYMELRGAKKDAGCRKVEVAGGVSSDLGCCNYFQPKKDTTQEFNCGNCEYLQHRSLGGRIGA